MASSRKPRPFLGIDGPGASGKSTFAEHLALAMTDAYVVHVDDFYFPSDRRQERLGELGPLFDLPRLANQIATPGSAGTAIHYQRYDWVQDTLLDWIDIPCQVPIIVEGVFCLSPQLRASYTYTIWCHADPALRLERGLARDGEAARATWVEIWMPAEDEYAATQTSESLANLVVDSSPPSGGSQVFRIVDRRA